MKGLLHFLGVILTVFMVLFDIAQFLALPVLLTVIGLINSYSWQYYTITIGGYFILFIIAEIILHFVFRALDKKYTSLFEKKLEKYFSRSSGK